LNKKVEFIRKRNALNGADKLSGKIDSGIKLFLYKLMRNSKIKWNDNGKETT
jgi:hypothetical protein